MSAKKTAAARTLVATTAEAVQRRRRMRRSGERIQEPWRWVFWRLMKLMGLGLRKPAPDPSITDTSAGVSARSIRWNSSMICELEDWIEGFLCFPCGTMAILQWEVGELDRREGECGERQIRGYFGFQRWSLSLYIYVCVCMYMWMVIYVCADIYIETCVCVCVCVSPFSLPWY